MMNRRRFLAISTVALASTVAAEEVVREEYSRELYTELLNSGEPFLLEFSTTW